MPVLSLVLPNASAEVRVSASVASVRRTMMMRCSLNTSSYRYDTVLLVLVLDDRRREGRSRAGVTRTSANFTTSGTVCVCMEYLIALYCRPCLIFCDYLFIDCALKCL